MYQLLFEGTRKACKPLSDLIAVFIFGVGVGDRIFQWHATQSCLQPKSNSETVEWSCVVRS